MPTTDPSANGGIPEKRKVLDSFLEAVDPAELQIDEIPTVEAAAPMRSAAGEIPTAEVAVLPSAKADFGCAFCWFLLASTLFLGTFFAALAIARSHYTDNEKILSVFLLAAFSGVIGLGFATYSALQKGFTFGKACLWCLLLLILTQVLPGVLIVLCGIIAVACGAPFDVADPAWMNSPSGQIVLQSLLLFGQGTTIVLSLVALRWAAGKEWKRKIALRLPNFEHVILVVVAMPALLIVSGALEEVVKAYVPSIKQFGVKGVDSVDDFVKQTALWPWGLAVLAIGIGPAIGEELWCRGFLGQGLARRYGNWGGVLLTSMLFGLIHMEPPQAVMAFLMGIVLHLSYLASRSIFVPMLMHFMNNTLAVLDISNTGRLPILDSLGTAYEGRPALMLSASLILLIAVGIILYHSRVRIWTAAGSEAPAATFPHVECPSNASSSKAVAGNMPTAAVGALIIAASFFGVVWYGL